MVENERETPVPVTGRDEQVVADRVAWENGLRGYLQARALAVTGSRAA